MSINEGVITSCFSFSAKQEIIRRNYPLKKNILLVSYCELNLVYFILSIVSGLGMTSSLAIVGVFLLYLPQVTGVTA